MNDTPNPEFTTLALRHGWDEILSQHLRDLTPAGIEQFVVESGNYDKDGWRHLLPALTSASSVVCLDARFGTTAAALAETGVGVTAVYPSSAIQRIAEQRQAAMNVTIADARCLDASTVRLPFDDESFDALVLHDIMDRFLEATDVHSPLFEGYPEALFQEARRVLKRDGFVYFGFPNRLSLAVHARGARARITPLRAERLARAAGFRHVRLHPYLMDHGRVTEVLPRSGYQSTQNSILLSERLKQRLLGRFGSRFFAHAYGLTGFKGQAHDSAADDIAADLAARNILAAEAAHNGFHRYFPMPAKVVISLGPAADGAGNLIVLIPKSPQVTEWRRRETMIVSELRRLSPTLARRLPEIYFETACHGETIFVMSEIPGTTIDRKVPHLERFTRNAAEFLTAFHREVACDTPLTEESCHKLFGALFRCVTARYPEATGAMSHIEDKLRAIVSKQSLPQVWMHGDYKLENLIFDPQTSEIRGIIDWEQSRRHGLPWLDLLYLIAYNRIMVEKRSFFEVYRKVFLADDLHPSERALSEAYFNALPVAPSLRKPLLGMFFLHHIGCRYQYNMRMEQDRNNIFTILGEINGLLRSPTP